jgi:hypothetical protein
VWFWFRFHRLEAAARGGDAAAMEAFHHALMGFPNSVYAKMLGKRKLVARQPVQETTARAPAAERDGREGQPRDAPGAGPPGETGASRPPG